MERIDYRLLPGTSPERVRELVWSLNDLALRIEDLSEARERMHVDPRLERVLAELREWRLAAEERFRLWSSDPAVALDSVVDISERLHGRLSRMEAEIAEAREAAGEEGFRVDYETLYRYLGGFRGLSEAGMGYAVVAAAVDWEPWREARF